MNWKGIREGLGQKHPCIASYPSYIRRIVIHPIECGPIQEVLRNKLSPHSPIPALSRVPHPSQRVIRLHEVSFLQCDIRIAKENLSEVPEAMDKVVTCLVCVVGLVEVHLHVIHTVQGVVCCWDEAMMEGTKMGETDTVAAFEQGIPVRFVAVVVESEAGRLLECHLDGRNASGYLKRCVIVYVT